MEVRMTPANTWLQGASRMPYRPRDPEDAPPRTRRAMTSLVNVDRFAGGKCRRHLRTEQGVAWRPMPTRGNTGDTRAGELYGPAVESVLAGGLFRATPAGRGARWFGNLDPAESSDSRGRDGRPDSPGCGCWEARLVCWQARLAGTGAGGSLDGVDDSGVSGAAADVVRTSPPGSSPGMARGACATGAARLISMPGVQKPHCSPWCATSASCSGCS